MTAPTQTGAAASTLTIAMSSRAVQLAIRAELLRDVTRLWPLLDRKRLDETFPAWLRAMTLLVTNFHGQSAYAAGRFYQAARSQAIQSPTPSSLIRLAPAPSEQWLSRAFGFSGPGMLGKDTARPNTALTTTLGTASRIALDGARTTVLNTVHADPVAVGWYRVTDGHPCSFCALLASRGVAYKSAQSSAFKSHNDCGCTSAPAFTRGQELPEISRTAQRVYLERGKGDALNAFRRAWDEHLAQTA